MEHGYPAITLAEDTDGAGDEDAPEVSGLLFVSEHLDEHWARLD